MRTGARVRRTSARCIFRNLLSVPGAAGPSCLVRTTQRPERRRRLVVTSVLVPAARRGADVAKTLIQQVQSSMRGTAHGRLTQQGYAFFFGNLVNSQTVVIRLQVHQRNCGKPDIDTSVVLRIYAPQEQRRVTDRILPHLKRTFPARYFLHFGTFLVATLHRVSRTSYSGGCANSPRRTLVKRAPSHIAPSIFASTRLASSISASVKSGFLRLAPARFTFHIEAPRRSASTKLARPIRAPFMQALRRQALSKTAHSAEARSKRALTNEASASIASLSSQSDGLPSTCFAACAISARGGRSYPARCNPVNAGSC